jgi:hypothetical protein
VERQREAEHDTWNRTALVAREVYNSAWIGVPLKEGHKAPLRTLEDYLPPVFKDAGAKQEVPPDPVHQGKMAALFVEAKAEGAKRRKEAAAKKKAAREARRAR